MNSDYLQDVLNDINTCAPCTDIDHPNTTEKQVTIDWMLENLPGIDYVLQRMLNYMFSNGMTTGAGDSADATLDKWLYEQKNLEGATNYSVLRSCIRDAAIRGECGIRLFENNLYQYEKGKYGILYSMKDGIQEVVAYFIKKNGDDVVDIDTKRWETFVSYDDIGRWFETNGYILLDESEFENLRNDVTTLHGYSPLLRDKQRINLIIAIYERLNYDIRFDGPGRIFLKTKDEYVGDNEKSTGEILNDSPNARQERYQNAMQEAQDIAKFIKNSSSDTVGVISGAFENNVIHLPRVTQAKEFLDWLSVDTVVMAQIIGMSPTLLEVGELHGNVSTEKIIDNAMVNTIIPMRENYAIQVSNLMAKAIGVEKVFFNKYDMQQVEDENSIRGKVASIVKDLASANRQSPSDDVAKLIDEFTDVLRTSIYDDNGQLRTL